MNNQKTIKQECSHDHIITLGENKTIKEKYDYCLNCGERIRRNFYHCLVLDATYYLEECPIETEEERKIKLMLIQERFYQMMREEGITRPEFLINILKKEVEAKRRRMIEISNKVLLKTMQG